MCIRSRPAFGLVALAFSLGLGACKDKPSQDQASASEQAAATEQAEEQAAEQAEEEPTAKAAVDGENTVASHPDCVGARTDAPAETFEAFGKTFERKGSTLSLKGEDPDDEFVIGQISDVKDFTPENKANLDVVIKWFKEKSVDAIAVTGDIGESQESIEKVLRHVGSNVEVPILAIAGNRECRGHFKAALAKISGELKHVVNMNQVRVFNADDAAIVSLPGYYNRSYIHCAEGCEYAPSDVEALDELVKDAASPVKVLISHGPPKQEGDKALDRIHEEVNVGDPKLAELLKKGAFPFGLFGNIQEAGGYGTDLSGNKRVDQGSFVDALYINPGPLDSVRWQMLDGTESLGMAALMKIKGKQASYEVYRIRPGEAKVAN